MKKHINEYLLDTNNCIYYSNALKKREERRSSEEKRILHKINSIGNNTVFYMSEATLGELVFGAKKSQKKEYNLKQLEIFEKAIPPRKVDREVWEIFGNMKAELSQKGRIIADMDLIIAATAKRYNLILATHDSNMKNLDFLKKTPIEREDWLENKIHSSK
jgi:predicted nucleic acid-binding protein